MNLLLCFLLIPLTCLLGNPFKIDVECKRELKEEDYVDIQQKLRTIEVGTLLDSLYPTPPLFSKLLSRTPGLRKKEDFRGRIERGIKQTLISPIDKKIPSKKLHKINAGGEFCIVSFASYDGIYPTLLDEIPDRLKDSGFNGYFLALKGGFPNPTGEEIQYCGVPYCFKLFALLEAKNLGFSKVLWIDSAFEPLRDPSPLFDVITKLGFFFIPKKNGNRYLLPSTHAILLQETGMDMYKTPCIRARIMGLDLETKESQQLLQEYRHLVEMGTPFLSCFPEEFVIGALVAKQPHYQMQELFPHLVKNERKLRGEKKDDLRKEGFFFLLHHH